MKKMSKVLLLSTLLFAFLTPFIFSAGEDDFIMSADEPVATAEPTAVPARAATPVSQETRAGATTGDNGSDSQPSADAAVTANAEASTEAPSGAGTATQENPQVDRTGDTEGIIIINPGEIEPEELQKYIAPVKAKPREDLEAGGVGIQVQDGEKTSSLEEGVDGEEPAAESSGGEVVFERAETDESGLMLVDSSDSGKVERVIPAAGGRRQVLRLINDLMNQPRLHRAPPTNLTTLLEAALRSIKRRSLVFIVSDFISAPGWDKPLGILAQRNEVLAIRLYDPRELELPDIGPLVFEDAETGEQLFVDTHDAKFRERFMRAAQRREYDIRVALQRAGVETLALSTDDDLVRTLVRFATARKQRTRRPVK